MFAFPCDAESSLGHSTPKSASDASSSESTAAPTSAPNSQSWLLPPAMTSTSHASAATPHEFPSLGSALHASGQCRPCGWFWKLQGCQNGPNCAHCHLCPPGEVKTRKKSKMAAAKLDASTITSQALAAGLAAGCHVDALLAPPLPLPLHLSSLVPPSAPQMSSILLAPQSLPPLCSELLATQPMKVTLHLGPSSPPRTPPRLMLPLEEFISPPPTTSPVLELSPGALPRSLAMACMDDETDAEDPTVDGEQKEDIAPVCERTSESRLPRVTLELSTALLPSCGAALHGGQRCTACAWFWKPQGCANGQDCPYCHLCPQGEIRRRRKIKNAALRSKAALEVEHALQASNLSSLEHSPWAVTLQL